jgi:hypothetical protein
MVKSLVQSVAQEPYATRPDDFEQLKSMHGEGMMKELGEIALAFYHRPRKPGAPGPAQDGEKAHQAKAGHDEDARLE